MLSRKKGFPPEGTVIGTVNAETREPRPAFLFDRMLGRLCRTMRLLGYDAELNGEGEAGRFLLNAQSQQRIPVTRARALRDRPGARPVVLEGTETLEQVAELFTALGLEPLFAPFTLCLECNAPLERAEKEAVREALPPYVAEHFDRFHRCPACGRIYWEGSHYEAMARTVEEIERLLSG